MSDNNFKIRTTNKDLENKINTNIKYGIDEVYWYIKFNIFLDENTVNKKTMNVTDTEGYIMKTNITYDSLKNLIVISPIDTYEQNRFYILNISKQVKSGKGNHLKKDIYILFKLIENQISEYKLLDASVKPPEPKIRPKGYDEKNMQKDTQKKLQFANMKVNILLGVLGLFMVFISFQFKNHIFSIISIITCIIGICHIILQFSKKAMRSVIIYNRGVFAFNAGKYEKAKKYFVKAFELDKYNELCKLALSKDCYYL